MRDKLWKINIVVILSFFFNVGFIYLIDCYCVYFNKIIVKINWWYDFIFYMIIYFIKRIEKFLKFKVLFWSFWCNWWLKGFEFYRCKWVKN